MILSESPRIEFINADCIDIMKSYADKQFELAIVDPPYGMGATNFVSQSARGVHKDKAWNDSIPLPEWFRELYRVSVNQIIWGCNYFQPHIRNAGRVVFDKVIPDHGLQNFSDCDLASQSFSKTIKLFRYEWRGNVQNGKMNIANNGLDGRIHPTQKPVALYKWLLKNYAKTGDTILDTHGGSFSSAIACHQMGFDFVGIEKDAECFDSAVKRFKQYESQGRLFEARP